jgi:hypothetical protein
MWEGHFGKEKPVFQWEKVEWPQTGDSKKPSCRFDGFNGFD